MRLNRATLSATVVMVIGLVLSGSSLPANAQTASDVSAFVTALVGRWQNDAQYTKMGRLGPHGLYEFRAFTYTYIFSAKDQDLHLDIYAEYPLPKPSRSTDIVMDGKPHSCGVDCTGTGYPGVAPTDVRAYSYFPIDSHMMARLEIVNGKITEYLFYALSSDGKTLSLTSWNPKTPQWQNIQVFDKKP